VSEVTNLIHSYRAGDLTLDELARLFRARQWPAVMPPPPASYLEMAASAQEDPRPDVPNSYDEVTAAYASGDLTREEYDVLSDAVLEAGRAEDHDGHDSARE
jgi:hypothetical protein